MTATATIGLREMKKQRTRTDIVRIATRMFAIRGFDHVTVEEIAAEAEISHRTFYRYFATKEELVLGSLQQGLVDFSTGFTQRPRTESVIASVRAVIMDLAANYEHDLDNDRHRAKLVRSTPSLQQRQHERHTIFESTMVPLIAQRLGVDPIDDIRPALIAGCAVASIRVATTHWLAGGASQPLLPIVEQALNMLTKAFDNVR
ncbi:MAG: TetR family transcriptional regulator [Ilumatobacteraceae bacterium]